MYIWRCLFGTLLVVSALLAWQIYPQVKIDTDLADVSPMTRNSLETQEAITDLRSSIEQRVIFLIQGDDEDEVFDAQDYLRAELIKLDGISVFESNQILLEKLFDSLLEYRFTLISKEQQQRLESRSANDIAQTAQSNLYKSSSAGQLFTFAEDPLAWHSETFFDLLNSSQSGIANRQTKSGFFESISLKINRGALNMSTQERISAQLEKLIKSTESNYDIQLDKSGVFFFAAAAASKAKADIRLISIGSGVGVILLLMLAFGSLRSLLLPLVSIVMGVGFAFVLTHAIYGDVHILTLVFGASLIGIVIDYSLHYFYHRSGGSEPKADGSVGKADGSVKKAEGSVKKAEGSNHNEALQRALLLSLGTSLIGYGALSFSSLEALQKVAFFSCCGLLMAWLSVVCFGEWATRTTLSVNQRIFPNLVVGLERMVNLLSPRYWFGLAILLTVIAGLAIALMAPFNDSPKIFFTPSQDLISSERKVAAATNDYEPGRYVIIQGDSSTEVYDRYQQLMQAVARDSTLEASNLISLLSWVPSPQQQTQNYQQYAKLYAQGGAAELLAKNLGASASSIDPVLIQYQAAAQRILHPSGVISLVGEMLPPFWMQSNTASDDQVITNFVLIRKGVDGDALVNLTSDLEGVEYVNTLQRTAEALGEQRQSAIGILLMAYALIAALVLIRYRQLRALWMISVPICASACFVVTCILFGVSLNLFHIMALFLVLGFGMDYTIFTKEMQCQSKTQRALSLQAIMLSALTSLLSFGLLGFSSMPVVASFGLTLLIGNIFNLLGVFVAARLINSTKI